MASALRDPFPLRTLRQDATLAALARDLATRLEEPLRRLEADEPWAERFAGQVAMVHAAVAGLAREAQDRGELAARVDVALLGVAYSSFFYFVLIAWVQGAHDAPTGLFERLLDQHLTGLYAPDQAP